MCSCTIQHLRYTKFHDIDEEVAYHPLIVHLDNFFSKAHHRLLPIPEGTSCEYRRPITIIQNVDGMWSIGLYWRMFRGNIHELSECKMMSTQTPIFVDLWWRVSNPMPKSEIVFAWCRLMIVGVKINRGKHTNEGLNPLPDVPGYLKQHDSAHRDPQNAFDTSINEINRNGENGSDIGMSTTSFALLCRNERLP